MFRFSFCAYQPRIDRHGLARFGIALLGAASGLMLALQVPAEEAQFGSLSGHISYQADAKQPWRFQRYYVANPSDGGLAEAVIELKALATQHDSPQKSPRRILMDQINFQFVPETIAVQAGDTVAFTNSDDTLHNVMLLKAAEPFNVNLGKDEVYEHRFKTPVEITQPHRLGCVYHGSMRGWVFVFDHPYFAQTGKDGRFSIAALPPGDYQLTVHHPAGRLFFTQTMTIKAGQTETLEQTLTPANIRQKRFAPKSAPIEKK